MKLVLEWRNRFGELQLNGKGCVVCGRWEKEEEPAL